MSGDMDAERRKYERMWATGKYGGSFGRRVAPLAWDWLQELGCSSVTDWGCKDGQAMRWFLEAGLDDVHGIDLLDVAGPDLQVVSAPISTPGPLPVTDFAFSADVLEHLPPSEVAPSLEAVRDRTAIGGFFQIATRPDSCGKLIGETLHLTVRPAAWWVATVGDYFDIERTETPRGGVQLWLRK